MTVDTATIADCTEEEDADCMTVTGFEGYSLHHILSMKADAVDQESVGWWGIQLWEELILWFKSLQPPNLGESPLSPNDGAVDAPGWPTRFGL